ncbi:MAG: metallophosphoesterase [Bacteroidota bacterium]
MQIQYASDLHLEFPANWRWLQAHPIIPKAEILLLAGDTYTLGNQMEKHAFFDWASASFEQVFLIPGNHEYYGGFDAKMGMEIEYEIPLRDNVHLLNNATRYLGDTRIIFSTLWSKVVREVLAVYRGMTDFRLIRFDGVPLSIDRYNELFEHAWTYVKTALETEHQGKTIVVTHHLPSDYCNLPKYRGSRLNEGFCTDLTNYILDSAADYWIYGHSHGNRNAFQIGETTLLTNQLGYVEMGEHFRFDRTAIIE